MTDQTTTLPTPEEMRTKNPDEGRKVGDATKPTPRSVRGPKKEYRSVPKGRAYIQASYNNTIVTITDEKGNVLSWSSAGKCGFKGPKKATAYAAGVVVRDVIQRAKPYGVQEVDCIVKGIGSGREAAVRALHAQGMQVIAIKDLTPIPHNGCRPPKVRRV